MLASDEMRAWYGPDHVALAADRGAIGTLLISDELFRYALPVAQLIMILIPSRYIGSKWVLCALDKTVSHRPSGGDGTIGTTS